MALSGVHVVYGSVHKSGANSDLFGRASWSETLAVAGTTVNAALADKGQFSDGCFSVRSAADAFVAIGPAPNAAASPRYFVPAGVEVIIPCIDGDKLAWTAA